MRRSYRVRHPAGHVRSEGCRQRFRRTYDNRSGHCHFCYFLSDGPAHFACNGICGMHAFRPRKRDCRSSRDKVHSQMVQRQECGPGNGTAAFNSAPGNCRCARFVPYDCRKQSRGGDLSSRGHQQACPSRTGASDARRHPLGCFCGNGLEI